MYYSFEDIHSKLNAAISIKTLKNWANKIEKVTDRKFKRASTKNTAGNVYSYKVFTETDLEDFQQLILLREENISLEKSMKKVFMSESEKKKQEKILLSKLEYEENKRDMKELITLTKNLLQENTKFRERLLELEANILND